MKIVFFIITLACSLISITSYAQPLPSVNIKSVALTNYAHPQQHIYTAGQPPKEQFQQLAKQGIKYVINLRGDGENNWDEQALVTNLGLQYFSLPISSRADINIENAKKLQQLLAQASESPTLLHCASGNRVGALIALYNAIELNQPIEKAIETGKQWGLKSLEPVVRDAIAATYAIKEH
ncbi:MULTISPECIES: fused DSP-PTPase phosphatase/NAD kinase-like protein [Pseudoalteromonas]|uniref:fused DSP-PTPase phosphatase/NAD kinase-like protein n=1 Tax=Pseudoalteromonas TaxID=53246 RepID=UPI001602CF10|nr:protein tyrosine phosphatase family protein [Pseudoalteromonas sp. SG43-6]MBB1434606.1 protein tyrosine phosphatase family protein [Pseudoalteromonas sp. SG43-6]